MSAGEEEEEEEEEKEAGTPLSLACLRRAERCCRGEVLPVVRPAPAGLGGPRGG